MRKLEEKVPARVVFLLLASALLAPHFAAFGEEPPKAEMKIYNVALFKNGLSYFRATATFPARVTSVSLGRLPVPTFGTFWARYPGSLKVRKLVTSLETVEEPISPQSVSQIVLANAGRRARLFFGNGPTESIEGTVVEPTQESDFHDDAGPYSMNFRSPGPTQPYFGVRAPPQAPVLLVKNEKGLIALHPGSVIRAEFEGSDPVVKVTQKRKRPTIRFEAEPAESPVPIEVTFLAKGITWVPGYLVDLTDPATATLSAGAQIINEVCDLDGVSLDLVTGFPNVRFGEISNPVAMAQSLADFLASLAAGRTDPARMFRNGMAQQAIVMNNMDVRTGAGGGLEGYSIPTEGAVSEDLFLFPLEKFSLKKGETVWVPLYSVGVPYHHVYTWKIGDYLDPNERYQQSSRPADEVPGQEVWHSCRLTNSMKMPLTTAAAEFVAEGRFVGQDMCFYTAPGARTTIKINRAMNVVADETESETERKRDAAVFYGSSFDMVSVRGHLKVRNRMDKVIKIEITKELSGEVKKTEPPARDTPTAKGLKKVNPSHSLVWEIEVGPLEERSLQYEYQVYIRN